MRPQRTTRLIGRASLWLAAIAFLSTIATAVWQTLRLQSELTQDATERAEDELQALVSLWEKSIQTKATDWIIDLSAAEDLQARERHHRAASPLFTAFYEWNEGEPVLQYPKAVPTEDLQAIQRDPCIQVLNEIQISDELGPYIQEDLRCRASPLSVRLFAVCQAAARLLEDDEGATAWDVLHQVDLPIHLSLDQAVQRNLAPERVLDRRLRASQALASMGDRNRHRNFLLYDGKEFTELSGGWLEMAVPALEGPILTDLRLIGRPEDISLVEGKLAQARERLAGYHVVEGTLVDQPSPPPLDIANGTGARILSGMEGNHPYVLLTAGLEGKRVGAVQVNVDAAIQHLRSLASDRLQPRIVVDASPDITQDPPDLWIQVPLAPMLPDSTIGLTTGEEGPQPMTSAWLVAQLLPLFGALGLGAVALLGRRAANARREEFLKRQQGFLTRVTHELKTPLAGIRVMAESLELGTVDEGEREVFARRIVDESDRLSQRIDAVLKVGRARGLQARQAFSANELVAELAEAWAPRFADAGATLSTKTQPCPPMIGDRALLRDALANLLDNALKYRRADRPGRCELSVRVERQWMVFDVADNGIGVPTELRGMLFEPFARANNDTTGTHGHGLGLSFVAETALAHKGTVDFEEGLDGGARLVLRVRRRG